MLANPITACMFPCRRAKAFGARHCEHVPRAANVYRWGAYGGMGGTCGGTLCCCCFSLVLCSRCPHYVLFWYCHFKPSASLYPFLSAQPSCPAVCKGQQRLTGPSPRSVLPVWGMAPCFPGGRGIPGLALFPSDEGGKLGPCCRARRRREPVPATCPSKSFHPFSIVPQHPPRSTASLSPPYSINWDRRWASLLAFSISASEETTSSPMGIGAPVWVTPQGA